MKDNIEQKIKKEFQQRTIKPSSNAWEVLNAQLEVKTKNKTHRFLAYAAVFIGLLFGFVYLFNTNNTTNNQPIMVDVKNDENKNEIPEKSNKIITNVKKELLNDLNKDTKIIESKKEEVAKNESIKTINKYIKVAINTSESRNKKSDNDVNAKLNLKTDNNQFIIVDSSKLKNISIEKNKTKSENESIENKTNKLKKRRKLLLSTDDDINKLLASAIERNPKTKVENVQLYSDALKFAVESDMKQPLSKKIYKTLVTGVHTVEGFMDNNN